MDDILNIFKALWAAMRGGDKLAVATWEKDGFAA
jgi:hypothetical protein